MKRLIPTLFTMLFALSINAQQPQQGERFSPEKFEADLKSFITNCIMTENFSVHGLIVPHCYFFVNGFPENLQTYFFKKNVALLCRIHKEFKKS